MMSLIDKMRNARRTQMDLGPIRVTIQRPTDMDALEMGYDSTRAAILGAARFVVDWDGMKEMDLDPGGTGEPVPYDPELFVEWIQDQPALWEPMIKGVRDAYQSHRDKVEASVKN